MGNIGDWRSPLPIRLGGGAHEPVDAMYKVVRAARPDALSGGEGTEVDGENMALALMLAEGQGSTELRVAQRDPMALSTLRRGVVFPDGTTREVSPLERWEDILLITPAEGASDQERRAVVAGRRAALVAGDILSLSAAMGNLFGDWFLRISANRVSDVDYAGRATPGSVYAHYGSGATTFSAQYPGSYDASLPWYSGVPIVTVVIQPPASVDQTEIDRRTAQALSLLDDTLPAWALGYVSQLPADQDEDGFYADISLVGLTTVLPMGNSRVFSVPIITGQRVTADQFNGLDDGQFYSLVRNGENSLLAATQILCAGSLFEFVMFDDAASQVAFRLGDQDLLLDTTFGSGSVQLAADRLKLAGTSWPALSTTRTLTNRAVPFVPMFNPADWAPSSVFPSVIATLANTGVAAHFLLSLPPGMTLTGYRVDVFGVTSGSLPGTMPTTSLYRFAAGAYLTPTETIGSQADTSANNAAYVAGHDITKTGLSHAVDPNSQYVLTLTSGFGGGESVGFTVCRVYVSGTISTLRTV